MRQPASALARPARQARPAPIKSPERCPHCNSRRLIKKGARQKKLERAPLYRCRACGRTFTSGPRAVRNKTYPVNEILEALTQYDCGSTLEETARTISSRHVHPVAASTISRWLSQNSALTTYRRLRARGRRLFTSPQVIRAHKLYHRQVYEFAYHRPKLALLTRSDDRADQSGIPPNPASGTLTSNKPANIPGDDIVHARSRRQPRFAPLASFLERVPDQCPHALFRASARASQTASAFIDESKRIAIPKENTATRMAALVLPTTGDNHARHAAMLRFMLANDSTTIAVEVPIWLHAEDIAASSGAGA